MVARIGLDGSVPKRLIASNCIEEKGFSRLECRFQRIPEEFFGLERVRSQCCVMAEGRGLELNSLGGEPRNPSGCCGEARLEAGPQAFAGARRAEIARIVIVVPPEKDKDALPGSASGPFS